VPPGHTPIQEILELVKQNIQKQLKNGIYDPNKQKLQSIMTNLTETILILEPKYT